MEILGLNIPKAETPGEVKVTLFFLGVALGALLYWLLGFPGIILMFLILAFTTPIFTQEVPEYHALTLLDNITGKQRVIFQGRTGKLPWEKPGTLVDLRTELKGIPEETWATGAGASMDAKYIFLLHPKTTPEGVIAYAGFNSDAVKTAARNLFSRMLSDHFGQCNNPKELLKKEEVNKTVLESIEGKRKIGEFELKYGVDSSAHLEDVDYDKETQKARDVISKATSIAEAVAMLMANKSDGKPGMSQDSAEKIVSMLNIPGIQENIITLKAEGLENLRDVTVFPPEMLGKGGKK